MPSHRPACCAAYIDKVPCNFGPLHLDPWTHSMFCDATAKVSDNVARGLDGWGPAEFKALGRNSIHFLHHVVHLDRGWAALASGHQKRTGRSDPEARIGLVHCHLFEAHLHSQLHVPRLEWD